MLTYSTIFDQQGNIHHQSGQKPPFLNDFIDKRVRENRSHGRVSIQDVEVCYKMERGMVFMGIGKGTERDVERMVARYYSGGGIDGVAGEPNGVAREPNDVTSRPNGVAREPNGVTSRPNDVTSRPSDQNVTSTTSTAQRRKSKKHRKWVGSEKDLDYSSSTIEGSITSLSGSAFSLRNLKKKVLGEFDRQRLTALLLDKNVAPDVVEEIMRGAGSLADVRDKIRAIVRVRGMRAAAAGRPRRIALVGTNGVGKTTTLSKLIYRFVRQDMRVYVAACDTFRAGAIEQLRLLVARLGSNARLHSQGYNKEEVRVARSAMEHGSAYDVILVDTAGRVAKKGLLDSLRKLCALGFDEVVYVSEALKGYNREVESFDMATSIIVTKIDAVEDKLGAVVNLCYHGKLPIVFVGYGQSNVDLEELDVEKVIELLLSE